MDGVSVYWWTELASFPRTTSPPKKDNESFQDKESAGQPVLSWAEFPSTQGGLLASFSVHCSRYTGYSQTSTMTTIIKRRSDEGDPSYTPQYDAILTIQDSNGEHVTDADKTTYLMLSALCNNHDDDHYKYRNLKELAKKLGLSPRALKERIARLRRIGWAGSGQWQWELVPVQTIMKFSTTAATHKRFAGPQQVEVKERKQNPRTRGQ